jgi:hypothetical protein
MTRVIEPRNNQAFWYLMYVLFFVAVTAVSAVILSRVNGGLPYGISMFDFVLIILATFRLTRLFVYDKVAKFFRDWFLDETNLEGPNGELLVVRTKPEDGPRRTAVELIECPWCVGVWFAVVVAFFYYLTPGAWYFILILAVAGIASLTQIIANMIGWRAEYFKREVNRE